MFLIGTVLPRSTTTGCRRWKIALKLSCSLYQMYGRAFRPPTNGRTSFALTFNHYRRLRPLPRLWGPPILKLRHRIRISIPFLFSSVFVLCHRGLQRFVSCWCSVFFNHPWLADRGSSKHLVFQKKIAWILSILKTFLLCLFEKNVGIYFWFSFHQIEDDTAADMEVVETRKEATHHTKLDPKNMKVTNNFNYKIIFILYLLYFNYKNVYWEERKTKIHNPITAEYNYRKHSSETRLQWMCIPCI